MKQRFILFRRVETYYCEDTSNGKQASLQTKNKLEALTLLSAKNEAYRQPALNLQIARAYLGAIDAAVSTRTWQIPMDEITKSKTGSTLERSRRAMQDEAFDSIRNVALLETTSAHFLKVLETGSVATNVFLCRIHNFALDMNWLPWPCCRKSSGQKCVSKRKERLPLTNIRPFLRERKIRNTALFMTFAGTWMDLSPIWQT